MMMVDEVQRGYTDAVEESGGIIWEATDIVLPEDFSYEQWEALLAYTCQLNTSTKWWIAKLINEGERRYGEMYAQAITLTGMTYSTIVDWCYVERNVPSEIRLEALRFSHHKLVAGMAYVDQRRWLRWAAKEGWTVEEMRDAIKRTRLEEVEEEVEDVVEGTEPPAPLVEETWANAVDWKDAAIAFALGNDVQIVETVIQLMGLGDDNPDLVYVDVAPEHQAEAATLLRQAYELGNIREAIFVSDMHPSDAEIYSLWAAGASAVLAETGTVYYLGENLWQFRSIFGEHGVVVKVAHVLQDAEIRS